MKQVTAITPAQLNSLEPPYVDDIATIDPPVGHAQDDWMHFWDETSEPIGNYADRAYSWLASKGQTQGDLASRWKGYWESVIINLYVNSELAGGAISGDGSPFPPTGHSLNFNQVVTSAPIDIGGGFFNWHSNTLNETGRAYLGYDVFANNPALPVGVYEFTYDCENTNPATQGQVFTAPLAGPNMTDEYILRNLGPFGTTVRIGSILTVTGPLQVGNTARVGSGTSSSNNRACIIKNPRLTKVGDI